MDWLTTTTFYDERAELPAGHRRVDLLTTTTFYDERARPVQVQSTNARSGLGTWARVSACLTIEAREREKKAPNPRRPSSTTKA